MEDKQAFSQFIAAKRKEKHLTQEELARRLYISPTAVSKWERGISYPDITLITGICRELEITEHEFVTACDDPVAKKEKVRARRYLLMQEIFQIVCGASYIIALITCFICNLAVNHTLSWFFIVLFSLAIGFCVTNLPFLLKRRKFIIPSFAITVLIYLLLIACCLYQRGDWLFSLALPIATYVMGIFWATVGLCHLFPSNGFLKSSVLSFFFGVVIAGTNPAVQFMLPDVEGPKLLTLSQFFDPFYWQSSEACNKLVSWILILYSIVALIVGLVRQKKKSK